MQSAQKSGFGCRGNIQNLLGEIGTGGDCNALLIARDAHTERPGPARCLVPEIPRSRIIALAVLLCFLCFFQGRDAHGGLHSPALRIIQVIQNLLSPRARRLGNNDNLPSIWINSNYLTYGTGTGWWSWPLPCREA